MNTAFENLSQKYHTRFMSTETLASDEASYITRQVINAQIIISRLLTQLAN